MPLIRTLVLAMLLAPAALHAQTPPQAQPQPEFQPLPIPTYAPSIFIKPIPAAQLTFLNQFNGAPANDLIRDKQFRKLIYNAIPHCTFHYGTDMSLTDALDMVLKGSRIPVQIRDGRYLLLAGMQGPYLAGRGFLWVDLQQGIVLGGFYFHPSNGEPTPSVNVFSRQIVNQAFLSIDQLSPAFRQDLGEWSANARVPAITTRYFITGSNKKILLEHYEDFCAPSDGSRPPSQDVCQQMDADAADIDMDAASYLEQVHHVTNATAWMINGPEQVAWLQVRTNTCGLGLSCRIRMTHQRTAVILHRPMPAPHPPPHPPPHPAPRR